MFLYRLRSIDRLLGNSQELERQEIYFASYDELNDPLEGSTDIFWHGDSIIWKNFFCHYLLCLNHRFFMAQLYEPDKCSEFFEKKIGVFITEKNYLNNISEIGRKNWFEIKEQFFADEAILKVIEYLSGRKTPIRMKALSYLIGLIQYKAIRIIISSYVEFGMTNFMNLLDSPILSKRNHENTQKCIDSLGTVSEDKIEVLFEISDKLQNEFILCSETMHGKHSKNGINLVYFLLDFPKEYFQQIRTLIHSEFYTACFASLPKQTIMWSHYAGKHTGACLIFKTNKFTDGKSYIELTNLSNGLIVEKIDYSGKKISIDFFRSLFNLPIPTLTKEWYFDEKNESSCYKDVFHDFEKTRTEYWEKIHKIHTTKKSAWSYENEYRVVLNDMLGQYIESHRRCLKYDFGSLDGIIFGIKTSNDKKAEIIRIIYEKCKENNRTDFKFYQAKYDEKIEEIVYDELKNIRFKFK